MKARIVCCSDCHRPAENDSDRCAECQAKRKEAKREREAQLTRARIPRHTAPHPGITTERRGTSGK